MKNVTFIIYYVAVLSWAVVASCKQNPSRTANIESAAKLYVTSSLHDLDSTARLDSFRLIRLDTLSRKQLLSIRVMDYVDSIKSCTSEMKDLGELLTSQLQVLRVSKGVSDAIFENYKDKSGESIKQYDVLKQKGEAFIATKDSLQSLMSTADSISLVNIQAVSLYQIRRKDGSVVKDTSYDYLTPQGDVLRPLDFTRSIK